MSPSQTVTGSTSSLLVAHVVSPSQTVTGSTASLLVAHVRCHHHKLSLDPQHHSWWPMCSVTITNCHWIHSITPGGPCKVSPSQTVTGSTASLLVAHVRCHHHKLSLDPQHHSWWPMYGVTITNCHWIHSITPGGPCKVSPSQTVTGRRGKMSERSTHWYLLSLSATWIITSWTLHHSQQGHL